MAPKEGDSLLKESAERVVRLLRSRGFEAYFAGGCVRDMLLGRTPKDFDVATNARPEEVQALFDQASDLQGKAFGVVRVKEGHDVLEVATFRSDGIYLDGRRPESVTFSTAEEDAKRRDFTINGMFYDPIEQRVLDYVGGEADLQTRLVRAIGDPKKRFEEDHLRIFRAIRFAAELAFDLDAHTWAILCDKKESTLSLAPERVRDELIRCFTGSHPARALDLLDESGLLALWLPEVAAQKGVEQPPQFHPEGDVYTHVKLMLSMLCQPSVELAFAVLLHDIGKPPTFQIDETGRIRFNTHETVGARMAEKLLRRLRFSNEQIENICGMVARHMSFKDVPNMRLSTLKRLIARPTITDELELHRVDCASSHNDLSIHQLLSQIIREMPAEEIKPPPLLNGNDLIQMGLQPGKLIGTILHQIEDEQLEGKLKNRQEAWDRAKTLLRSYINESHS